MFTILFKTNVYRPDCQVTVRNNITGWDKDHPAVYKNGAWVFEFPEADYPGDMQFKFVLEGTYWMYGNNLLIQPMAGSVHTFDDTDIVFPPITEAIVENSRFQQMFFKPNFDENHVYDVIVVGSGIGGGIVAEQLSDLGLDVLILEAGSLLFQTHTANLPRKHKLGEFDKHLWSLFDEYKVTNYTNAPGSKYNGGQAFNLGGRSVFWGGFIPRMSWWELDLWPQPIRWYLEGPGYTKAEDLMFWPPPPSQYQRDVKTLLENKLVDFDHLDAPMGVRYSKPGFGTLTTGLFSTADLLTESRLTVDANGSKPPTINLNHAVIKLETQGDKITEVQAIDLLGNALRNYKSKYVILSAGTLESAKIAKLSNLKDPNNLIGKGITDHPVLFTHFSIPQNKPWSRADTSSKTMSQHKRASLTAHPYNILLELGADLNQGRYLDADTLARHRQLKGNATLCEIVFLFNAPLVETNQLTHTGSSANKVNINMQDSPSANAFWNEVNDIKNQIIAELGGEALPGKNLNLGTGGLGGVAHEVGTLRMGVNTPGIVDENLKYNGYDNLFVCDLSVFPSSPAANPTLTLAALALRLAEHIKGLP